MKSERYTHGFLEELCRRYDGGQRLSGEELRYLVNAGRRALDSSKDPFQLRPPGRPPDNARQWMIAHAVWEKVQEGLTLDDACEKVCEKFGFAVGNHSSAHKAHKKFGDLVDTGERRYAAMNRNYSEAGESASVLKASKGTVGNK